MVAAFRATGDERWDNMALELADVVVRSYRTDQGWLDRAGGNTPSRAVVDDVLPASIATLTAALLALDAPGNGYGEIARTQATRYLSIASAAGAGSAAFWRSWDGIAP